MLKLTEDYGETFMKILCSVLLAIAFVLNINAQTKTLEALEKDNATFKKGVRCTITYDKFKDVTSVISGVSLIGTTVTGIFNFEGQTLNVPVKSYFVAFTTPDRIENPSLIFIANGERVNIGKAVDSNSRNKNPSNYWDVYRHLYEFTPEQLEKFVGAEKVDFQIGTYESSTRKDTSEKLKSLLTLGKVK